MKARPLSVGETRSRIRAAMERAGRTAPFPVSLAPEEMKRGGVSLVRSLPAWVGRFGLLAGPKEFGLWCEPLPGPGETFPSQLVIDVPPGRYMIEILDAETSTWVSRESAEGGPLVAGLPCTGNPVFVWIRLKS